MKQVFTWLVGLMGLCLVLYALVLVFPPLAVGALGVFLLRLAYIL